MDIVTTVLEAASKQTQQVKSINVRKHIELEKDVERILAVDTHLNIIEIRFVIVYSLWPNLDVTTCGRTFDLIFHIYIYISDRSHAGINM
jgi:hypothetical protein